MYSTDAYYILLVKIAFLPTFVNMVSYGISYFVSTYIWVRILGLLKSFSYSSPTHFLLPDSPKTPSTAFWSQDLKCFFSDIWRELNEGNISYKRKLWMVYREKFRSY
jgi:hypothetical protein